MLVYIAMFNKNKQNKNPRGKLGKKPTGGRTTNSGKNTQKQLVKELFSPSLVMMKGPRQSNKKTQITMSPCAAKFALAVSEPFHPGARGACLPFGGMASQKVHAFTRFVMTAGTGTFGFVSVTPSLANDTPCLYASTGALTGGLASALSANSTLNSGVLRYYANQPYKAAQLIQGNSGTPQVMGRIVSAGVRIQSIATLMNRSGVRYCYVDPTHASISGAGVNDVAGQAYVDVSAVDDASCGVTLFPINESEFSYSNSDANQTATIDNTMIVYPFSNNVVNQASQYQGSTTFTDTVATIVVGAPVGVIMVSGVLSQNSFQVEYIQHTEYVGYLASPVATKTDADSESARKVITAASTLVERKANNPSATRTTWDYMFEALGEIWHEAKPIVVPAALSLLATLI